MKLYYYIILYYTILVHTNTTIQHVARLIAHWNIFISKKGLCSMGLMCVRQWGEDGESIRS